MRTITAAERAAVASLRSGHWIRVEIWDSTSTYLDYTTQLRNIDFLDSMSLDESIDQNCISISLRLLRSSGTLSLAPFMAASLLNQVGGSYATLLDLWRKIRISVAVMRAGYPPTGADWKEICQGRVDKISVGDQITVIGRSEEAVLLQKWISSERSYGSVGGIAMETVIQSMLDDNLGAGVVTLYTPTSPAYLMNSWTQPKDRLMPAIVAVADKAGFTLRYRYDASNVYRLTLFKPNRTASVEDWTLGPSEYTAVPQNDIGLDGVRNFIKERFAHATLGTQTVISPWQAGTGTVACVAGAATFSTSQAGILKVNSEIIVAGIAYTLSAFGGTTTGTLISQLSTGGVPTFAASAFTASDTVAGAGTSTSLARFGRSDLEIDLAFTSQVNDPTKAQAMADAIRSDTEFPNLEQQFEVPGLWFAQLHDYVKFDANGVHYDSPQWGGITSIRLEASNGTIRTTLGARGKPSGKYIGWRYITGAQAGASSTPQITFAECIAKITATTATTVTVTVTANPASPPQQVQYVGVSGSATLSSGTAAGSWVTPNGTNNVWVFNRAAINAGVGHVQFRAGNVNGYQTDDDFVSIEEQGRDTVYLAMRARVTATALTAITVRVAVADPYPQGAASVSIATQDLGVGSATTPASPQTVTPVATITEAAGTFVDYTVTRPAFGAGAGRVTFTASAANRTTDSDAVDVPPQDRDTQGIAVRLLRVSEAADQVVIRVEAITPNTAATVTVNYDAGGLTVSPATGGTFSATTSFGTTNHLDYTITRDAQGGSPRRVTFTVTASGNIDGTDGVDVPPNSTRFRSKVVVTGSPTQTTGTTPTVFTAWTESGGWDIGALHDDATNPSRFTIPSGGNTGAWLFHASMSFGSNTTGDRFVAVYKNGSSVAITTVRAATGNATIISAFFFDNAPSVGDYYEVYIWQNSGSTLSTAGGTSESFFSAIHLW